MNAFFHDRVGVNVFYRTQFEARMKGEGKKSRGSNAASRTPDAAASPRA
jgi:hypothetical protein